MRFILGILYTVLGLVLIPVSAWAATSDYSIRTFVGSDVTPPSTPTITSVVPVASSQINISWTAVIDDVAVGGYRIFRDAIQIATTTLINYSDTGLLASTTYTYTIDAFDVFSNISTSSAPVSTTTLAVVVPPIASTSTSTNSNDTNATQILKLKNLEIISTKTTATFIWETTGPTQYTLSWGRTLSYELGTVAGSLFQKSHNTVIGSLEPGTVYYYELKAVSGNGIEKIISTNQFTTQSLLNPASLLNVSAFKAVVVGDDVKLSWKNNFLNTDEKVRIVRSTLYYPDSIFSGAMVYEGNLESFVDKAILSVRSPQYYTIFVLDSDGNVSSGAVAFAQLSINPNSVEEGSVGNVGTNTDPVTVTIPDIGDDTVLSREAIIIVQNNKSFTLGDLVQLDKSSSYLVSIPYDAVPKHLKSIIVSVQSPTNYKEVSAYLLKLNQLGDAYEATIFAPNVVGQARLTVELFDFERATVRRISTPIQFVEVSWKTPFFPDRLVSGFLSSGGIIFPISVAGSFWWFLLWRRRRQTEDNNGAL